MKLIVGLGNPEEKYRKTFHNLGFIAVEDVALNLNVKFTKNKCKALIAEANVNGEKVIIAKPQTYMNLSGESVRELLSFYKLSAKDMIVIYDDYDLPKGSVRIRKDGSAGTHNGMKNIVACIGVTYFPRIRIGIKDKDCKIPLINYVLAGIKEEDYPLFSTATKSAGDAATRFAYGDTLDSIMQKYNVKTE